MATANNGNDFVLYGEVDFFAIGFRLRNFDKWEAHSLGGRTELFQSLYGTSPSILAIIWEQLCTTNIVGARLSIDTQPAHLLLVYRWMRSYETEFELKTQFNMPVEKIRQWCRELSKKIALLRSLIVRYLLILLKIFALSHLSH